MWSSTTWRAIPWSGPTSRPRAPSPPRSSSGGSRRSGRPRPRPRRKASPSPAASGSSAARSATPNRTSVEGTRARWALAAILFLAAVLRFTALSWGLRHAPHWDERVFVENAARMAAQGDLDHRFYEYPGLFFLFLAPVLAVAGPHPEALGYLAARAVVAAFGVAGVFLASRLGSRMMGPRAGLAAALMLAVSPVDVRTAHMVRPDVVLQAFVLLAFLALLGIGERPARDARAGAAVGAAIAVKFTGLLLAPSYVAQRLLAPGPRARGALFACAAALAVALCATPYALLHHEGFARGLLTIARGRPAAGWLAALAAVAFPLVSSAAYLRQLRRPSTWDQAVNFVGSQAPPGSRILSTERDLGLDRQRFEVLPATGSAPLDDLLARNADLVVAGAGRPLDPTGLRSLLALTPDRPEDGPPLVVYSVPDSARPRYAPFPLARAQLTASEGADMLDRMRDGRLDT